MGIVPALMLSLLPKRAARPLAARASQCSPIFAEPRMSVAQSAPSRDAFDSVTISMDGSSGRRGDDDDFVEMVTGMRLGFQSNMPNNAADLTRKCASAPQLVAHLSKMMSMEPPPRLTGVTLSAVDLSPSLHWPRRGGL